MPDPRRHPGAYFFKAQFPRHGQAELLAVSTLEPPRRLRAHPDAAIGKQHEPAEVHPRSGVAQMVFVGMHLQPKVAMNPLFDLPPLRLEYDLIVAKQQEVIHVADIPLAAQLVLHEMIQCVEIDIRPELARQVPDRQAAPNATHRKKILAPNHPVAFRMAGKNVVHEFEQPRVANHPRQLARKDGVVDVRKILADVALERIGILPGKLRSPTHPGMGSPAFEAGIAILDMMNYWNRCLTGRTCVRHGRG